MKTVSCRSLVLVLLICLPSLSFSYEGDPLSNAIKDLGHVRRAPLCLKERSNLYLVGGVLGAGVLLYANDRQVLDIIQKNKSTTLVNISRTAEKTGNGAYELAFLGGVAGAGYVFKDDKLKDTAFMGMESFLAANAIGTVMKYSLGRARPYHGNKHTFSPFNFSAAHASFPSGHTTSAFSIASVFAARYDSLWVGGLAYGAASAVALQRLYSNNHWPSDVLMSAFLGTVTGRAVVRFAQGCPVEKSSALVLPVLQPGYSGLTASVRF